MKIIALLLLTLIFATSSVIGQEQTSSETAEETKQEEKKPSYFKGFFRDAGQVWTYPFHLKTADLIWLAGITCATGLMIANDEGIYREIKKYQADNEWLDRSSPFFSKMCEGYPFGVAGLFLLHGLIFRDAKSTETGVLSLQAMIHSFLVVQLFKHVTGRQRPSVDGSDKWNGPSGFLSRYDEGFAKYDAFFSGHTVTIWSLATVIAHEYKGWVGPLAYTLATLGGMATITEDLHWISDVFLGAVVGFAIGRLVYKNRKRDLQILPALSRNGFAVGITYGW